MTKGYKSKKSKFSKQLERERKKIAELQREIEEREASLNSPSSSSTATTSESTEYSTCKDEEEETTLNILDTLYDTIDSSSDEELADIEQKYMPEKSLSNEMNFFENFEEFPDITNISEDISICTIKEEKELKPKDSTKDMGHFVDPLTGSDIQTRLGSSLLETNSKESYGASEDTVSESQQSELSENLLPDDILFEETRPSANANVEDENANDMFERFLQLDATKIADVVDEVDWETIAKQQEDKLILQYTLEFINDVIHRVVETAESISSNEILRQNLDKRKLLVKISQVYQEYEANLKVSDWLNRKVVEFFKRKKIFRPIMPENIKTFSQEKVKYMQAIKRLDQLLAKEKEIEDSATCTVERIQEELEDAEQKVHTEVLMFEGVVKRNVCRENRPQMNDLIEQLLRKMAKYRKEVSEVRYRLITKQHTHAVLSEKLTKLENLGNDLTLKEYDHIQTENQILDKKIEERNVDLKKLHLRSRNCLHLLAHFKEKQSMLSDVIATQRSVLFELNDESSSMRKYIYQLKLKRSRIRQEISELSIRGGLIDKPALMYDYDQTVKRLSELHDIVNRLRITLDTIQQKILKLEKRLTGDNHNFSMVK